MSKKVIRFSLDANDIDKAIREIEKYKVEFQRKVDTYRQRIAEEIKKTASLNFGSAVMDDVVGTIVGKQLVPGGSPHKPKVTVSVAENGGISVVVADGEDAVWCEFGAGVYHNGSVGSSPNPYGYDLGFTIGSYGFGHGRQQVWGYYIDPKDKTKVVLTRGTPASMPMYNATQEVMKKAIAIAREVFG